MIPFVLVESPAKVKFMPIPTCEITQCSLLKSYPGVGSQEDPCTV